MLLYKNHQRYTTIRYNVGDYIYCYSINLLFLQLVNSTKGGASISGKRKTRGAAAELCGHHSREVDFCFHRHRSNGIR